MHGVCRSHCMRLLTMTKVFILCPQVVPPNPACPAPRPRGMAGLGALILLLIIAVLPLPAQAMKTTDALGRQVTIPTPVRRIVALNSDSLEILRTLKAQDRIVGVYAEILREPTFWGTLTNLPKTGGWRTPNLEAIADLAPDLVLTYSRNPGEQFDRKMAALGIPVLRLDFYKLATLEDEVKRLGELLGKIDEARSFCDWHAGHLALIRDRVAEAPHHPAVYIESYSDLSTVGPTSGAHEMCLLAGGRNIAADTVLPYPKITPEWVLAQNPEIIVKAAAWSNGYQANGASSFNARRDAIMKRPVWSTIPAVQNGRVHVMDSAIWTGPRALIGVAWLARWFYPQRFADVDPNHWHGEYLQRFQGIAYQGIYTSDSLLKETR
ncbi:ABC transporter substrate-binding protein [Desulfosarcina variabilis]|uniref:ABC transporter substrate-binding protein n=1 Tax=Desulfosarcina variabilis TaxID=2300 RepID=UPI003AFA6924